MKQKAKQSTTSKEIKLKVFAYGDKKRNQAHTSPKHGIRNCGCNFTEITFQFEEGTVCFSFYPVAD